MRAVIQRVKKTTVKILSTKEERSIGNGLLVFLAIKTDDTMEMIKWFANKIVNLRIFPDSENKMNLSVRDINGEIMVISNFTLYGDVSRGFRPNFMFSANPELAKNLYQQFVEYLRNNYPIPIVSGDFGEMMNIELVNDGPVTIIIDK
jgi:D-tyrosyl-tRNA(Tyr) deacylase